MKSSTSIYPFFTQELEFFIKVNRTVSEIDLMTSGLNSDRFLPIDESLEGEKLWDIARERLRVDGKMAVSRHPLRNNRFSDVPSCPQISRTICQRAVLPLKPHNVILHCREFLQCLLKINAKKVSGFTMVGLTKIILFYITLDM